MGHEGTIIVSAVAGGAFALGLLLGALRLRPLVRGFLFAAGPVAALIVYRVIDPNPGCSYDCPGKFAWALILSGGTVALWAGLALASLYRWWVDRSRSSTHGELPSEG
jgi:hypothetical protein